MPSSAQNPKASLGSLPEDIIRSILLELRILCGHNQYFPWRFATVNRRWRTTCIEFPLLWTNMYLLVHKCRLIRGVCVKESATTQCTLHVQRSSPLPFDVDCTQVFGRLKGDTEELCSSIISSLRIIALQCHRIRSLSINFDTIPSDLWQSLLPQQDQFPALETLGVHCTPKDTYELVFAGDTSSMSSLRTLYLARWSGRLQASTILPWAQLTHVQLQHFLGGRHEILIFLSACHSLETFQMLGRLEHGAEGSIAEERVQLNHLKQLGFELCEVGSVTPIEIFPKITAPKLDSLILEVSDLNEERFRVIAQLITGSDCKLRRLRVPCMHNADITPLLRVTPLLRDLHLVAGSEDLEQDDELLFDCNTQLKALIGQSDSVSTLAPHLKSLTIQELRFDPILLGQVIKSRNSGDSTGSTVFPIKQVHIRCGYDEETGASLSRAYARTLRTFLDEPHSNMIPCRITP